MKELEEIKEILKKYKQEDYKIFSDTVQSLSMAALNNGTIKRSVIMDIHDILISCERIVKKGSKTI